MNLKRLLRAKRNDVVVPHNPDAAALHRISIEKFDDVFVPIKIDRTSLYNSVLRKLEWRTKRPQLQSFTQDFVITGDGQFVTKLIEDILLLIRNFCRATSKEDYIVAIVTFTKLRSNKSFSHLLIEQFDKLMGMTLQSSFGDSLTAMRGLLDNYTRVKTLPIFKKIYKFLTLCIGTTLFEKMGVIFDLGRFFKIEKAMSKKEFHLGPDFVHCLLDTLLFIVETGYQCMVTGNLDPIFHHESTYEKWVASVEELKLQSKYTTNPEPHGFTIFDFLNRLDDTIQKGDAIVRFHKKDAAGTLAAKYYLNDLKIIRSDCLTKKLAQQDRKAPFAVLVSGDTSAGKSTFTKMLYYHFGKLFNLPTSSEYRYVRNPFDQYWTNFNSSQWCTQLDDIAFLHPNSSQGCDPSLMEMLQVVNNVPYVPTQADLVDKGKTPLRSRFVVATTNTKSLNAESYFACPLAVQRRLPYIIDIKPKEFYCKDGMLDGSSLPEVGEGEYPDFWNITIYKVVAKTENNTHMGQVGKLQFIRGFDEIIDFLEWFNEVARAAEGIQSKSMACDENMSKSVLCEHGYPKAMRQCCLDELMPQLQADEEIPIDTPWVRDMLSRHAPDPEDEVVEGNSILRIIHIAFASYCWMLFGVYTPVWILPNLPKPSSPPHQTGLMPRPPPNIWERFTHYVFSEPIDWGEEYDFNSPHHQIYRLTLRGMVKEIARMDIVTRFVVWFYAKSMSLYFSSPKITYFMSLFYGNWAILFMATYFMHYHPCRVFIFRLLGHRAYRSIARNKNVLIFCAAVVTAVSLYKTFSWMRATSRFFSDLKHNTDEIKKQELDKDYQPVFRGAYGEFKDKEYVRKVVEVPIARSEPYTQNLEGTLNGTSTERGVSPEPKGDKQENVWYKDQYECTTFDVHPSSLSKCNWSLDDVEKFILPNCVFFVARVRLDENTVREKRTKALCIGGHIYMCNNHSIPFDTFELDIIMQQKKDGVSQNISLLITPTQLERYPDRDLLFIKLPSIPPKKNIKNLFAKETYRGVFDGRYMGRDYDGSPYRNNVISASHCNEYRYADESLSEPIVCDMWQSTSSQETKNGDCGAALVVKSSLGPIILGIHVLAAQPTQGGCFAIAVTSQFLEKLFPDILSNNVPTLQVGEYSMELTDLGKKSTLRYIPMGVAQVYGSFTGFRGKLKSRVTKTIMSDVAVKHGFQRNTGPPMMNSWIPWHKAIVDMTRPVTHIDLTMLEECTRCYTADILAGLTAEDLAEVKVYDNMTAINGKPGLAYVDKLNRNTSAGFPFRKSKKYFLNALDPIDDLQHPVEVTPEILAEMDKIIECYESGKIYCPVFTASLKDEPTLLEKCKAGKTRVFCGAPMPWSIVVRKYFLSIIRLIQKNRFLFESAPGTIAQSKEWDAIYQYLIVFGLLRIIAGDYGKFDKRMPASVIIAAFSVLIAIMKAAGWTEKDLRVVMGIGEDTAYSWIDFHGDLIRCYGTNPSGHPLTVIINCIANCLYVRYCYMSKHPERRCDDFKKYVRLFTYGDDLIMSVSPDCHWLNHTTMVEVLGSIDIEFTMADKNAPSVPFIHINDATFLRRSWRFDEDLGYFVCPIEHASIDKMMTMCVASKTISPELQGIAVFHTAVREYFWYGRVLFEAKRKLILEMIKECELEPYLDCDLPTWDQLSSEFLANSTLRN